MKKRILAFFLAITLIVGMLPVQVFAADAETTETVAEPVETTAETEASAEEPEDAAAEETTIPVETETEAEEETEESAAYEEADGDSEDFLDEIDETAEGESDEEADETTSVTVAFAAQEAGEFLAPPQLAMEVSSDTAESYGYTDQTDQAAEVSTIDVLVAAHAVKYGDAFNKDTAKTYLKADGNFITVMFGSSNGGNVCMLVNGKQPGNAGVEQAVVENDDLVEFFVYQDLDGSWSEGTQYTDKYTGKSVWH